MALFWLALAAATATQTPQTTCELKRPLKVSVDGAWVALAAGTRVDVGVRGKTWTEVRAPQGLGKAATGAVEAVCPVAVAPVASVVPVASPPVAEPVSATTSAVPVVAVTATPPESAKPMAATPTEVAPAKRLVAVLDVKGGEGLESTARALTTVLAAQIGAEPGLKAVAPSELKALLTHQADASLLGCETVNCLANVAKLVDAEWLATGTVELVEGAYVLSLSLIEPSGPSVLSRQESVWRGSADDMLALVRPLVQRMTAGSAAQGHQGTLEVVAPEGARVVVDGKEIGTAPLAAALTGLTTGAHALSVEADNHLPYQSDVVVANNETTVARVSLEEIPLTHRPLFWAGVGAAVLIAGGAAAGITAWAVLSQERPARAVLGQEKR